MDGLTLLAAVTGRAGAMDLVTSIGLPSLRSPVPYAAAMRTLATLSQGRVIAGVGPGSSREDYDLMGIAWQERWVRFDEASRVLRTRFDGGPPPVELWPASWGSPGGMRRVSQYGDGWLASAYHSAPAQFGAALALLNDELARLGHTIEDFGHASLHNLSVRLAEAGRNAEAEQARQDAEECERGRTEVTASTSVSRTACGDAARSAVRRAHPTIYVRIDYMRYHYVHDGPTGRRRSSTPFPADR